MSLIKTSILSGIATLVRVLTLLGINKILAIYVGPAGYAAIGQFQNAIQMVTTFASGSINNGVIKYTAEYFESPSRQKNVWRTAGTMALAGSLIVAILMAVFSNFLAKWFLGDSSYGSIFRWFAVSLVFFSFNSLLLAILNGKKDVVRYVIANILGSVLSLGITAVLTMRLGIYGALVSLAIYQSFTFFATLTVCYRTDWFKISYLLGEIDMDVVKDLTKYIAMALTSAVFTPMSYVLIRSHLGETLGWKAAGYWEAIWRLSAAYLMLVTTTLSVYYLPKLAELKNYVEIKKEIIQGYKIILPVTMLCGLLVYALRDFIVGVLFTKDFTPMRDLFSLQLLGDTFKIGSWIISYLMLGKAMFKLFISSEIFFSLSFYLLTVLMTRAFGLEGVVLAHAINYLLYWVSMALLVSMKFKRGNNGFGC